MPKSRHRKHKHKPKSLLLTPEKELERIESLIEAGDLPEALDDLKELAQRWPHRAEIYETIFLIATELGDRQELLDAAIHLVELRPNAPEHHYNLYGAYKQNLLPALAVQTGRNFLKRWPNSELGRDMRQEIEELAKILRNEAIEMHLPDDSWLEQMVLHEQTQAMLARGRYEEARRLATELIAQSPQFPSPYNNRSLASMAEGNFAAAIADARQVLEIEPNNVHALSNLTRFLRLSNHLAEAREIAERLKSATSSSFDVWTKKAEAFSYLADDAAVLLVVAQAEKAGALFDKNSDPVLLHLGGVAAARLGKEKKARKFWQEMLKRAPSFYRAQANLDDLDKLIGERNGAWAFDLLDWLSPGVYNDFAKLMGDLADSDDIKPIQNAARIFVQKHPHVLVLAPVLWERGDPGGREFALRLAQMVDTPESLAMIKDFVHSPHGPDQLRFGMISILTEAGIFQKGEHLKF